MHGISFDSASDQKDWSGYGPAASHANRLSVDLKSLTGNVLMPDAMKQCNAAVCLGIIIHPYCLEMHIWRACLIHQLDAQPSCSILSVCCRAGGIKRMEGLQPMISC